ncbi:hypothetical protein L6452_38882 [Arctium lappa]|uniref:Uncharacterized protein n=1 Tax=Arctium lappa TaxID=4217 RepID=A0ACB8XSG5_ARCLA|nr:hypothetical protein L6452_38882 [Arctium lappa]
MDDNNEGGEGTPEDTSVGLLASYLYTYISLRSTTNHICYGKEYIAASQRIQDSEPGNDIIDDNLSLHNNLQCITHVHNTIKLCDSLSEDGLL